MADVDDAIADARDAVMAETAYSSGATGGLKRQRSSSWSDDDRPPKQAKEEKSNETVLDFEGLRVRNPVVCVLSARGDVVPLVLPPGDADHAAFALPDHYVVVGDVTLFGLVDATISVFQGRLTAGHPYSEIVTPAVSALSVGAFLPSVKGSPLDSIALENLRFTYSEVSFDARQSAGLYLETDVVFRDSLQPVADILHGFFQQAKPALHVSAFLGARRNWTRPPPTAELVLRGSLEGIRVDVLGMLTFTRIGVEVGFCQRPDARGQTGWQRSYGFFGDLHLKVPGSVVPLQVQYKLTVGTAYYVLFLLLKDDEWRDVFGVKGLSVRDVQMTAVLASLDTSARLELRVEAALAWNDTHILLAGTYSPDAYALEAFIGHLTLAELGALFTRVTGYALEALDHDVVFDAISLCVSSSGLVLSGAVTVAGHSTARATIRIAADGIHIAGDVGDVALEHVTIQAASLDLFIGSAKDTACARTTRLRITGSVVFAGIQLAAGLHLGKAARGGGGALQWTVYATATGALTTRALCPALAGTFLDVSLRGLALIASNEDTPSGDFDAGHYPLSKGVQFCALVDDIPPLRALLRGDVRGMVLRAAYAPGASRAAAGTFQLGLVLPGERTISFGDAVYTGPLSLEIQVGSGVALVLKAVLNVQLATQPDPLVFVMSLSADSIGASVAANMVTDWVNPCNVGQNVRIRGCALEFGIVYSTFFASGLPGQMGIAGQLSVGSKEVAVAAKLSQNPKELLLAAHVADLGVVDLVRFASLVADTPLPDPDDFLHVDLADLYISTGARIGIVEYPRGVSLKGRMRVLGKRAQFECSIGAAITIRATVERFSLGPLGVRGAAGADPVVDIELALAKQTVLIDGAVDLWGASAALHLAADMLPSPKLDLSVDLRLSDLFVLQLEARLAGAVDVKDLNSLADADFAVHALMQQHVVEHVMAQLEQQVAAARNACRDNLDGAQAARAAQETAFQAACQAALRELERARAVWHRKRDSTHGVFAQVKAAADARVAERQRDVDRAEAAFRQLVADASRNLEALRAHATAAIRDAQYAVDTAQRDSDDAIRARQGELHSARVFFDSHFGSAVPDLRSAKAAVAEAQRRVDSYDDDLRRIDRAMDDAGFLWSHGLWLDRTAIMVMKGKAIVDLGAVMVLLRAAELTVGSAPFAVADAVVAAAQAALEATRLVKTAALDGYKDDLAETINTQGRLVQGAIDALRAAEQQSNELRVVEAAKAALADEGRLAGALLDEAQQGIDALAACAELAAFQLAETGLVLARDNTKELVLARYAVDVAQSSVAEWAVQDGGAVVNLTKIEFAGSVKSLIANGPPLAVTIEGTVFGERVDVRIIWQPHFDLVAFIKALFSELWAVIKDTLAKTVT